MAKSPRQGLTGVSSNAAAQNPGILRPHPLAAKDDNVVPFVGKQPSYLEDLLGDG